MQDTNLLNKISQFLKKICDANNFKQIQKFALILSQNCHINEKDLQEHLEEHCRDIIGDELRIEIKRDDIAEETAILYGIHGE